MLRFIVFLFLSIASTWAQVGEVVSLSDGSGGVMKRGGAETALAPGLSLQLGDILESRDSHVVILLYPSIQMSFVKGSELRITNHLIAEDKTTSLVDLVKGLVRVLVTPAEGQKIEQKIETGAVAFAVRGTEYEVSADDEAADLDVIAGEVEVTSPYVHTLVPEIVKPREGFRFQRKNQAFSRRQFRTRIREARFLKREAMRERWGQRREKREAIKEKREKRRAERRERMKDKRGRGR